MKAKFSVDIAELTSALEEYSLGVKERAESNIKQIMTEPVVEISEPLAPKWTGQFRDEMLDYDLLNEVTSTGTGFMTAIIIDPEQDEDTSKMLDAEYYRRTGVEVDTQGQYGKHAYFNSFSGKHDFFATSLPKAMPFIQKNMQTHLIRRG